MTCTTVRTSAANPDIAGIGIILAFAVQALISLALSITAKVLETPGLRDLLPRGGTAPAIQLARDVTDALRDTSIPASTRLKNAAALYMQHLMKMSAGFIPVSTRSSTMWTEFDSIIKQYAEIANQVQNEIKNIFGAGDEAGTVHPEATGDPTSKEAVRFARKQSLICQVLIAGSDAQTMTGIALTITAIAQAASLSMYHLHIVYDTINLTAVSNFAAISCAYSSHLEGQRVRYCSVAIFLMLYLTFVIMFGIRLNDWNDSTPGQCYSTARIAVPDGLHPVGDQIYLGVTSFYCFALLSAATIESRAPSRRDDAQKTVIVMGSLQFILHVYTAISLRISNQSLLDDPSLEDQWGFGQILAVVMLGATVIQCGTCLEDYYSWRKRELESATLKDESPIPPRLSTRKTFP